MKSKPNRELEKIPGVGKSISEDLMSLGIHSIQGLQGRDPQELYQPLWAQQGKPVDRCMLYVFRCAIYYASTENHDPELLKWWNWKNREWKG